MLAQDSQSLENYSIRVKQYMHTVNMYVSDFVMTFNTEITSVANTLKKIHLS